MLRLPSIRSKLFALFLVAGAVPLVLVSLIAYFNSLRAIEEMTGNGSRSLAESVAEELGSKIDRRAGDRILWVNQPVQDFLASYPQGTLGEMRSTYAELMQYLPEAFEQFGSYYEALVLADASGEVLYKHHRGQGMQVNWSFGVQAERIARVVGDLSDLSELSELAGIDSTLLGELARLELVPGPSASPQSGPIPPVAPVEGIDRGVAEGDRVAARLGKDLAPGEVLVVTDLPSSDGSRLVRMIHPVFDNRDPSRRLGVAVTNLRTEYVFRAGLTAQHFGRFGELAIVDRGTGQLLFHSRGELVGEDLGEVDPGVALTLKRMESEPDGHAWWKTRTAGAARVVSSVSLGRAPWAVVATALPREFEPEARQAGFINLVVALIATLAAVLVLAYSSGRISHSIGQVTRGAQEIAEGNLDQRIDVRTHDEIQVLGEAFNQMTASLRESIAARERAAADLRELNVTLEDRVEERTRELQALADRLEQANRELKELDRLKTQFLANVSHEFKTPLTSIQAFSEILVDEVQEGTVAQSGQAGRFLGIIHSESQRLGRLIRNLLSLSQIESGRIVWHVSRFPLGEAMEAALDGVLPLLQEKGITVDRISEGGSAVVEADRDRIQEVATNLLDNAVKFSGESTRIGLRTRIRPENGTSMVEVTVEDHGCGIPVEKLESIFDRFSQVDPSDTREKGGTGLGLAICREIVEHHGGRIWVESSPGEGAAFHFTLPVVNGNDA